MYNKSAEQLRDAFILGDLKAVEITEYFLKRIQIYDKEIGSFLQVFTDQAMQAAERLDQKRRSGKKLGKLAGIPIGIKDNIHIKGELTTCASRLISNYRAVFDATATRLLKEEDGILIGKTNLDEFAMGGATEYSAFLKTHNPWDLDCTPGGSSGGSAAAVAARLCPIALGTDTGGSVRQPGSYCGILGYKPTYGRISRHGLVAFGSSLDQIGPMTWNTSDLALVSEVLGVHCKSDATSLEHPRENYHNHFRDNLNGLKIGVPYQFLEDLPKEVKDSFEKTLTKIKNLGAELQEIDLTVLKHAIATYYIIATAEASTNLAKFDGIRFGCRDRHAVTLDEVYDLTRENGFGFEVKRRILLGTYVLSSGHAGSLYKKAQKVRSKIIDAFNLAFANCDLIMLPTAPTPAFKTDSLKDPIAMYLMDLYTVHANLTGMPAISVPADFSSEGKPIGVQFVAPALKDAFMIGCAHAFEKVNPVNQQVPKMAQEDV